MEHWHVPYKFPRAEHAQAWLLKCLEGTIARGGERDSNWMFKQRYVAEHQICLNERGKGKRLTARAAKPSKTLVAQNR
jgi:hypothetical protein